MPFLPPNQQCQSTEGTKEQSSEKIHLMIGRFFSFSPHMGPVALFNAYSYLDSYTGTGIGKTRYEVCCDKIKGDTINYIVIIIMVITSSQPPVFMAIILVNLH